MKDNLQWNDMMKCVCVCVCVCVSYQKKEWIVKGDGFLMPIRLEY